MKSRAAIIAIWLGCLLAASIALGWLIVAGLANPRSNRARKLAIGFDQTVNAAIGGSEDETMRPSQVVRTANQNKGKDGLFAFVAYLMWLIKTIAPRALECK